MKSIEQQQIESARNAREAEAKVAETRRLFRLNREANLIHKIKHLEAHGMTQQAKLLRLDLNDWREALKNDPAPEQTYTPRIVAEVEANSVEIPDEPEGI